MTEPTETEIMSASGCPVSHTDYTIQRPLLETCDLLNAERERGPFLWNDSRPRPFWMITDYEHVLEALQMPDVFSNEVINALAPEHTFDLLPQYLDPPEHTAMRRVLNRWFAPAAVRRLEPLVLRRCAELIEELRPKGGCDLVSDFAIRFPTDLFLATLNLPISDGDLFLDHVENVFKSFAGHGLEQAAISTGWIRGYFDQAIAEREREPQDTESDFISRLLVSTPGGEPIPREDIITICYTLMLAGLDTTRSALGYIFHHLARDPGLRHRLTAQPELWPKAVEEFLRLYPLVYTDGRLVTRDIDFHGMPMRQGNIVWLGLGSANHDPHKFPAPRTFELGREQLSHHLSFGAGPHRCLGMHLARHELIIAVTQWHTRIPDYELATTEQLYERGQQLSINRLPLRWDPQHREPAAGFDEARRIRLGAMMPDPRSGEHALRSKFMLIFRGGAVARHDLSPSELQAHVEKWYRWSDELARQGRGNVATALDNPGAAVRGHERVVTDGPYAESKDLVTGSLIIEAASLEDAIDVARTCPTYEFGGSVEVRPVQDHRI